MFNGRKLTPFNAKGEIMSMTGDSVTSAASNFPARTIDDVHALALDVAGGFPVLCSTREAAALLGATLLGLGVRYTETLESNGERWIERAAS